MFHSIHCPVPHSEMATIINNGEYKTLFHQAIDTLRDSITVYENEIELQCETLHSMNIIPERRPFESVDEVYHHEITSYIQTLFNHAKEEKQQLLQFKDLQQIRKTMQILELEHEFERHCIEERLLEDYCDILAGQVQNNSLQESDVNETPSVISNTLSNFLQRVETQNSKEHKIEVVKKMFAYMMQPKVVEFVISNDTFSTVVKRKLAELFRAGVEDAYNWHLSIFGTQLRGP